MSSNIVCVNGVEAASDYSKPTVITININQPSGLATIFKSAKGAWQGQKTLSQDAGKTPATSVRGEQKVLGAVQIMIGLFCVFYAVMSCFIQYGPVFYTGSGFWTGIPFILAGVVSIIAEKRGSPCWVSAAWLMNLASLAVAIAGIVMIANDFRWTRYLWSPSYICDREENRYNGSRDQTMEECIAAFSKLLSVLTAIRILLLVATSLALCIALWSLGYGCKTLCCNLVSQQEEDVVKVGNDKEQLLASKPMQSPENHPKTGTMSSNIVCINGVEVASDSSKSTVINININQPSVLATLLESAKGSWKGQKTHSQDAGKTPANSIRGEQKVLGAVQIMIGLLCVFYAVMSCFIQYGPVFFTGSGFWTGVPFILAGAVSIIAEKRGSPYWVSVAWLMNLASLAVAIAGIVMIANDFTWFSWQEWRPSYLCDRASNGYNGYNGYNGFNGYNRYYVYYGNDSYNGYNGYYGSTRPPSGDQKMEECMAAFSKLLSVLTAIRILLLVVTSLAICIALWSMGYSCKTLCCNLVSQQEEDVVKVVNDKEQLLASNPLQSPENHPKVETV